jgi:apolipoprotein N-acyltransferase
LRREVAAGLALASGFLALAAECTAPQPLLAWLAPVPVLVSVLRRRDDDPWWLGLLFGLVAHVPVLRWAWLNPGWPLGATIGAYAGLAGLKVAQLEVLAKAARNAPPLAPAAFAAAVTLSEWLLELAQLALWWTWGAPFATVGWLHGLSALGGAYLVSFVGALGAATLALLVALPGRASAMAAVAAVLLVAGLAVTGRYFHPDLTYTVTVAAVVQRLDPAVAERWDAKDVRHEDTLAVLQGYERLTREAAARGATIVVWPEYAVLVGAKDLRLWRDRVRRLAMENATTVVAGYIDTANGANRAMLASPAGHVSAYTKQHLAPGIESAWQRRGNDPFGALLIGDLRVGTRICYDAEYPAGFRAARHVGVQVMAIPSRDWRGIEVAHAAPVPYRASENGFAVVRATRGGRSLIVDPNGGIVAQADDDGADVVLVADVPVPAQRGVTLYGRVGNWPPAVAVLVLGLVALRASFAGGRRRRAD